MITSVIFIVLLSRNKQYQFPLHDQTSSSYAHLSQNVSGARPPVDPGLAEPPLLLLHHQRLRPARSSGKLHLQHFLNFFLSSSLSSLGYQCRLSRLFARTFSAPPVWCQRKSACWRLHCSRLPALLRPSGKIWSTAGHRIRDNSIPQHHHWWSKLPMTHHPDRMSSSPSSSMICSSTRG